MHKLLLTVVLAFSGLGWVSAAQALTCDPGWTRSPDGKTCTKNPTGPTYPAATCPSGFSLSGDGSRCVTSASPCPAGSSYNDGVRRCSAPPVQTCPSGTRMQPGGQCQADVNCPPGSRFSNNPPSCIADPICPKGKTNVKGKCQ